MGALRGAKHVDMRRPAALRESHFVNQRGQAHRDHLPVQDAKSSKRATIPGSLYFLLSDAQALRIDRWLLPISSMATSRMFRIGCNGLLTSCAIPPPDGPARQAFRLDKLLLRRRNRRSFLDHRSRFGHECSAR